MHFDGGWGALLVCVWLRLRIEARIRAREVSIAPSRLVRRVSEMSSGEILGRRLEGETPAALMRMSTGCCEGLVHYIGAKGRGGITISFSSSRIHDPGSDTSPIRRLILPFDCVCCPSPSNPGVCC